MEDDRIRIDTNDFGHFPFSKGKIVARAKGSRAGMYKRASSKIHEKKSLQQFCKRDA